MMHGQKNIKFVRFIEFYQIAEERSVYWHVRNSSLT